MKAPNLFLTLSKYGSREAEDYLTESFVLLIKNILEHRPAVGLGLLNNICGLTGNALFDNPDLIAVSTQVIVDQGRPDIEIRAGTETLAYIEIKHDAALGEGQLEYYKKKLDESGFDTLARLGPGDDIGAGRVPPFVLVRCASEIIGNEK